MRRITLLRLMPFQQVQLSILLSLVVEVAAAGNQGILVVEAVQVVFVQAHFP